MSTEHENELSPQQQLEHVLEHLMQMALSREDLPEEDTPAGRLARQFFSHTWAQCRDGLLKRTEKIRMVPEHSAVPHRFRFEIDTRYVRKFGPDAEIETIDGTVFGQILYAPNLFENFDEGPSIAVLIDRELGYYSPNYCQKRGVLCIGDHTQLPAVLPLDDFVESHLFPILSYQNVKPSHPLDPAAAKYFAMDPNALDGLQPVAPLY